MSSIKNVIWSQFESSDENQVRKEKNEEKEKTLIFEVDESSSLFEPHTTVS